MLPLFLCIAILAYRTFQQYKYYDRFPFSFLVRLIFIHSREFGLPLFCHNKSDVLLKALWSSHTTDTSNVETKPGPALSVGYSAIVQWIVWARPWWNGCHYHSWWSVPDNGSYHNIPLPHFDPSRRFPLTLLWSAHFDISGKPSCLFSETVSKKATNIFSNVRLPNYQNPFQL